MQVGGPPSLRHSGRLRSGLHQVQAQSHVPTHHRTARGNAPHEAASRCSRPSGEASTVFRKQLVRVPGPWVPSLGLVWFKPTTEVSHSRSKLAQVTRSKRQDFRKCLDFIPTHRLAILFRTHSRKHEIRKRSEFSLKKIHEVSSSHGCKETLRNNPSSPDTGRQRK